MDQGSSKLLERVGMKFPFDFAPAGVSDSLSEPTLEIHPEIRNRIDEIAAAFSATLAPPGISRG